jgi:hypothetical protein
MSMNGSGSGFRKIDELSAIELTDNQALALYTRTVRDLCRNLANELGFAAEELRARLGTVRGSPLLFGGDSRVRAKFVSDHLNDAAERARAAALAAVVTHASFIKHFAPELEAVREKSKPKKPSFEIKPE